MDTPAPRHLLRLCVLPLLIASIFCALAPASAAAQSLPPQLFSGLRWRLVGPFRAGRVVAVSGVPGGDGTFYFGGVDGGVWKTTDAGTVWQPVFDHERAASIGALAVAPSDPKVIYAGTGESDIRSDLASGDGVYRSEDGGATWKHIGLEDSRQISRILVDPNDARTVYVGVLGHAYGPNAERGVYKSTDGGDHWQRVLDKGPDTGIADIAMATNKPQILFAATWNAHRSTWSTYAPLEGPGDGLYRSIDGGATWTEIAGHGLPDGHWGRTGIAVGADGRRVYVTIDCPGHSGLYRSDDGGDTWSLVNADPRLTSRAWYFSALAIDPSNADVLYIPNVALYRTKDGGKTIQIVRGAPGGDDYHQIWVDPKNPGHLALGVDQGATISLDHGHTWTTWYNQPTAQLYHVTTDHRFPYTIYGAQQDSGSIAVHSRSDHGHLDARDWFLPGDSESGYLAIDPKDENIIYLSGTYGTVQRFDRRTSLSQTITPWPLGGFDLPINKRRYRDPWTPVLVFSPADKTSLYLGTQYVMKTTDGGLHWQKISPDLTGAVAGTSEDGPATTENAEQRGFGVVYTIAPSPLSAAQIWAGSDTGRIHLTTDGGKTWHDVTPPGLSAWSKIALIEASRFDAATAYAAVDRHRLDDQKPYLYITHDFGKTWKLSVNGIAPDSFLNAVREDPEQRNLLFAGTELGVYVSFNDGGDWQPLQLNLPVSSIRDLNINGSDLIVATHGRSFWVLDDIAPLRQAAAVQNASAYLYAPPSAVRVDNDGFLGTPLPPEEPQADNPPNGAIVDYYLRGDASKVTLQILDAQGHVLRHFSSEDKQTIKRPLLPIAERWFPKPEVLATNAGEHRFIWDLESGGSGTGLDDDDDDDNASMPPGPRVPPGVYTLRLSADGTTVSRPLHVIMDPRAQAATQVLDQQYSLAAAIYEKTRSSRQAMAELESVESQLKALAANAENNPDLVQAVQRAQAKVEAIKGGDNDQDEKSEEKAGLATANEGLGVALRMVESGDRTAPSQAVAIYQEMSKAAQEKIEAWRQFRKSGLDEVNAALVRAHREPVEISAIEEQVHYAMTR
ncbi:WD40/YVTN/BNR-like repeat-containing protein [Paracidobacterium acidisoli]|uniref:Sortilin N-terminal domain-containing protein n=1 Tax=Paracidobacterium acidisoli TaxID=2303751 RepID=A0A372IJ53_9BACT|nr:hypothetical protein [Paracidobacterium acidisoli]MBT9333240.1 hypothetical protein [Paracidobacterium acidisoli]